MRHKTAVLGITVYVCFFAASHTGSFVSFVCFAILGVCALLTRLIVRNKTAALALTGAAAAFLFYGAYSSAFIDPLAKLWNTEHEMSATVLDVGTPDNDTVYVTVRGSADGVPVKFSFYGADIGISPGDELALRVKFYEPVKTAAYSGDRSYSRGVFVRAAVNDTEITAKGGFSPGSAFSAYSAHLRDTISSVLTGDEGALIRAMCFGDKSGLDPLLSGAVERSGLSHMTAVSGMHISLIVTTLMSLLDTFGLRKRRVPKFIAAALLSLTFVIFFDMTSSVCRSAIMLVICYGAPLFSRKTSPFDSLGAAVLLILLAEPCACRDAGLLLSACGTLGAGTVAPRICERLHGRFGFTDKADFLIVSVCAWYCTLPATALIFGKLSLVSAFSAALISPLFIGVMICALAVAFSGGILAPFVLLPAGALLKAMIFVIRSFAGLRYSCIELDPGIMLPFVVVSAAFSLAVAVIARKMRNKSRIAAVTAVVCFCALVGLTTAKKLSDTAVTRIKVYSDGKNCLMTVSDDTGISAFSTEVNRKLSEAAADELSARGTPGFELMCVLAEKEHMAMYSRTFDSLGALEKHYLDNTEVLCDVGGRYTAEIYEDAVRLEINGVSVLLSDTALASVYGSQDIAIYSGYKKSENYNINGVTVLCDKRYSDPVNAYSAYYYKTELRISPDGRVLVVQDS